MRVSRAVWEQLGYYVYAYLNAQKKPVYIGKGHGSRALAHRHRFPGHTIDILAYGLKSEATALKVEAAAIDLIGRTNLSNAVRGHGSGEFGRRGLQEIAAEFDRQKVKIEHPCMLFKIQQRYSSGMEPIELYESTRGFWKLGHELTYHQMRVQYALAVYDNVVREVYEVAAWLPGGTTAYFTRASRGFRSCWEFVGCIAPKKVRDRYLHKNVGDYFNKSRATCVYAPRKGEPLWDDAPVRVPNWRQ